MTDLDIANYALGLLGQYKIQSYPETGKKSVEGQALEAYLPFAIQDVMIDGEWNFARKRVIIEPSPTEVAAFGYHNAFPKPDGLVTIISVNGEPWNIQAQFVQIEGEFILANVDQLRLVYIAAPTDGTTLQGIPDQLKPLIGIRWAYLTCVRITNNIELYNMIADMYQRELHRMRDNDFINNTGGRFNYRNKLMSQSTWGRYPFGTTAPYQGSYIYIPD